MMQQQGMGGAATGSGEAGGSDDPLRDTWSSVEAVVSTGHQQPPQQPPQHLPGPLPPQQPHAAAPPSAALAPAPLPAPAPEPGPVASHATPQPVPQLGDPPHSGKRPPSYAPVPQGLRSAGEDPAAAVLPDIVVDGAAYGPLTVRAASVRGDSHRYLGEPRQDALCVTRIGGPDSGELLLLAVADGVGSAARSHVGSNEVCRHAAVYLDRVAGDLLGALRSDDLPAFTALANEAVGSIAVLLADLAHREGQHRPEAYATTLRILLVPLDPAVRTRGYMAVGDGGTALLRSGAWQLDVTQEEDPEASGMIDTRTAALPLARTAVTRLLGPAAPGDVLVLSTDGLSTPLSGDQGMRDFLSGAWGAGTVPGPADFLWQSQFRVKSYDDDRSVVVLWECPA
ncbi:protein phosphatase 2C domain-containing protein [Streptomyces sp. NBC_00385]|uniref:protein phosphatase 2C domain-containing protein n=1 Tax=Streptomyces sp. NBC_00385 TaxID=2975733 RepID=UPI002DD7FE84|nr:protein phosphatase 2C domain-containing protein [Streptomyces sp. NBC_00385]WRZ06153.1 protein phosphatase 2C domain-containing protein [Streptomyces sp. NBC_00385]